MPFFAPRLFPFFCCHCTVWFPQCVLVYVLWVFISQTVGRKYVIYYARDKIIKWIFFPYVSIFGVCFLLRLFKSSAWNAFFRVFLVELLDCLLFIGCRWRQILLIIWVLGRVWIIPPSKLVLHFALRFKNRTQNKHFKNFPQTLFLMSGKITFSYALLQL